jgi:cytochrome c oxidase assembly protein subunit 15
MNSTNLAFIHGCTAEAFFALMVALCVLTGRDGKFDVETHSDPSHIRRRSLITLILIYAQMVVGAQLRHFGSGLIVHALMAAAVWGHAVLLTWRIERNKQALAGLVPSGRAMAVFVSMQVVLGIVAWLMLRPFDGVAREVSAAQALIRVGHQGVAALLLASSVVMTMRAFIRLESPHAPPAPKPVARTLEAVV